MILLDTSTLLWTLLEPERLSSAARAAIEAGEVVLSVASFWEVVIKSRKAVLPIADPVGWWSESTQLFGGRVLSIRTSHICALAGLPDLHKDPFDRILIAQAASESLPLVTNDRQIAAYPVRTLW